MRRIVMCLLLTLAVVLPAVAQDQAAPEMIYCCNDAGGMIHVSAAECPAGWRLCTPAPEPTVAPTPVPEGPKEVEVPGWLTWLLGILANRYTLPIAFGAVVISVVAGLKQLVALFGGTLGEKGTYLVTLFMAFATALSDAVVDGAIAGQEWVVLLSALATFIAAIAGYKLLFSGAARARIGK